MYLLILSAFLFFSSTEYTNKEVDLSLLINTWTHSREENKSNIPGETYRPSDYMTFPPARFRQIYKFNADYTCSYLFLSPTDGHHMKHAKWKFDKTNQTLLIVDENGETKFSFHVYSLENDLLILQVT